MKVLLAPVGEAAGGSGPGTGVESAPAPEVDGGIYGVNDDQGAAPGPGGKKEIPAEDSSQPDSGSPVEDETVSTEDFSDPAEGNATPEDGVDEAPAEVEAPASPTMKLDPETIAALKQAVAPQAPSGPVEPARMSSQEIKALLNPVEVTADTLRSMGFENATPEQIQGFQTFAHATVRNAVSVAKVMIQQARKEVESTLGPIMQEREQRAMADTNKSFYSTYAPLKKYEAVVKQAAAQVNPVGANGQPKTGQQVFKEVAALAAKTLGEYGIAINLNGGKPATLGAGTPGTGIRRVPTPPRPTASGRSGGSPDGKGKANDPQADIYSR